MTGIRLLVSGHAAQLVALIIFILHGTFFAIVVQRREQSTNPRFAHIHGDALFRTFLVCMIDYTSMVHQLANCL